jgi:polysaccharide biosynthesis/export protein
MRSTTLLVVILMSLGFMTSAQGEPQKGSAPAALGYGTSEFRLGPDDVIEVSVYQEKDLSQIVPVRPDGKISIQLIGEIPASGKTARELEKEIASRYARFIAEPSVTVIVKEVNSPKVSVLGEVKNSGAYKIKDRATILDVIAQAGGTTEYAKRDSIKVIRVDANGEQRIHKVNLDDFVKEGRRTDPFYVQPYDQIYVP